MKGGKRDGADLAPQILAPALSGYVGLTRWSCELESNSLPQLLITTTMASVSTYLNFARETEAAFLFYQQVFGTDFAAPIMRFKNAPTGDGCGGNPPGSADGELVMHVCLPILGGHLLMGSDTPESMGFKHHPGNNVSLNLQPDTRSETDRLFAALAEGGNVQMNPQEMFWGDYFGNLTDKFGVQWMFNCASKV